MKSNDYFKQRMKELGITTKDAEAIVPDVNTGKTRKASIFSTNEYGDIAIHYLQPNGAPYVYRKEGNKTATSYIRYRLKNPIGNYKYRSPKGQGQVPWFPPQLINKFSKAEPINQLNFIEGEFKTFAASLLGADAVGMGGIHGFYGAKENSFDPHFLHEDIVSILRNCKVKTVCLCLDADALAVSWKYDKDLYTRQNSFRTAVLNFYKVMQFYIDDESFALESIYFSHIKVTHNIPGSKGIDDLIHTNPDKKETILKELTNPTELTGVNSFFDFLKLDENYYTTLEQYFGLQNVEAFYALYANFIGKKQFVYKNARYVADNSGNVVFVFHKDVEYYFRIGTDWMKKILVPNKFDGVDEKIVPFSISEINRDYPAKKFPGFVDKIKKYDAYCNKPDWSDRYSREHSGCYNLSNPISHKIDDEYHDLSIQFVKHIFSGEGNIKKIDTTKEKLPEQFFNRDKKSEEYGNFCKHYKISDTEYYVETGTFGDQFTVGLDWLTIFHRYPMQMLPVPILVSKEFGTGKSTFFKWLKAIYGSNVAILNNEQFKMRFNAHYITKSLIIIDEGFLDVDKRSEKERLKQLVTSDTAYVEHKGVNLQEFPYYGKVMMGSNDADSVMKMDSDENRWFVVKVNPIADENKDPDMEQKLLLEIGSWLQFLEKREIFHKREQRLWFKEEYFITEQFKEIVKNTKSHNEKNVDDIIKNFFLTYRIATLKLSMKTIVQFCNDESKYRTDKNDVKKYLQKKKKMELQNTASICHPIGFLDDEGTTIAYSEKKLERYFQFEHEDWIDKDDFNSEEDFTTHNLAISQGNSSNYF